MKNNGEFLGFEYYSSNSVTKEIICKAPGISSSSLSITREQPTITSCPPGWFSNAGYCYMFSNGV
jgi:hypothetical protein